ARPLQSVPDPDARVDVDSQAQPGSCAAGTPDEMGLQVAGAATVPGHVVIESGPASAPRPLADFDVGAGSFDREVRADVAGLPEGPLEIRGRLGSPAFPAAEVRLAVSAFIDRTAPVAQILQPAEGSSACVG